MRILLIGFMGCGKSVVGKRLAKKLNIKHVDMDLKIEELEKKTITNIFKDNGEEYFRKLETEVLMKLILEENIVISTGGGIVSREENIDILKKENNVVFLDANVSTIKNNVSKEISKRPLLKESNNIDETIKTLLSTRIDKYNHASNVKINVNNKNIDEVVGEILVYIG